MATEEQRFARRSHIPKSKGYKPTHANKKPNLRPVEQTLYILLSENSVWHLVDEFSGSGSQTSAMEQALRRRGATVRKHESPIDANVIQVWAKWEHDIPKDVYPWIVDIRTLGSRK